jgi:hypothetical protein
VLKRWHHVQYERESSLRVRRRGVDVPSSMTDDVSTAELQKAVEHMHGVPARFVESVEVDERHEGKPVWQGAVKVFELTGHPSGAKRAYAWSYATTGKKRRFIAILGLPPVDDAIMAVRTAILAQVREAERAQN